MDKKPELDNRFIIELQGQQFVQFGGLLDLAHQIGIKSMDTKILQYPSTENGFMAICKTTVTTNDDKVFSDIGDAAPSSVNSMLTPHILRMASTRSKARTLRDLTNIGMTALDEINVDDMKNKTVRNDAMDTNYNKLLMEAQELQQKLIANGKTKELAAITGGKGLTSLRNIKTLSAAIEKARKLV